MAQDQKTIVIVEDEPDTAEMFAEMMRLSGYQVLKSYSGRPAIALISETKPDAIVLDLMMPDISGLEVMSFIRSDSHLNKIPVVIVSAKSLPSDIKTGLEAGAVTYLTKPVSFKDLKLAVEGAIRGSER
jgi:DNA-binding response OmpR family regulator